MSEDAAAGLARQAAEFRVLQRVSTEINATLDLDEIYDIALRTLADLFEFHHSIILLVEPGGESLQVVASRGYENQAIGGRVRFGIGTIGIVAQKKKMLQLGNLGQQRAYAAAQRRQMVKAGRGTEVGDAVPVPGLPNAESQIAVPLLIRDELIGVFSIESPVRHSFKPHELDLILIVANQIASAIRNAQLYEEAQRTAIALQEANVSLEARVAERTEALQRELRVAEELLSDARSRVEGPLIGESSAVRQLRGAVTQEATRMEPLLLVGPPGAGKEAVAYAVHAASRRKGAFIFVSCPELQTPRRGGDSDLTHQTPACAPDLLAAKLELAAGGTIFLESVAELPADMQASLRLVIESQDRSRAGGEPTVPDVRIIASSTDPIRDSREPGGDVLIHLIGRRRLAVPPLVERREDIPEIVDHFVRRLSRQFGKVLDGVSADSMQRLRAYAWAGQHPRAAHGARTGDPDGPNGSPREAIGSSRSSVPAEWAKSGWDVIACWRGRPRSS